MSAFQDSTWLIGTSTMQSDEVMIQCPNDLCKAANSESDKFCQRCGTALIKRYLWAVGEEIEYQVGELVAERYLLKSHRIFLDTKPGLPPEAPYLDISSEVKPYLRLVTYRLQVPQAFGLIPAQGGANEILLLEQAPIYTDPAPSEGELMPQLLSAWTKASSLRQLNWLWQMAQLWQPLKSEGVASSLLIPQLLRVDSSLVRLLQLELDGDSEPTLSQLGQFWSRLALQARPAIAEFLSQLSQALQQQEVQSAEQLIACLDRGLTQIGQAGNSSRGTPARTLKISTCTDTGPSRQRNEDACYPVSGTTIAKPPEQKAIAIVCDGIGGHEGGNVASNLAIETLTQQVNQLPLDDANLDPLTLSTALERFACTTNDRISQRNDKENRQARQRMGTTLVMAVGHQHEIYITHVGDSRAYWIKRTGCNQITLDDDVAAREVRLGYAVYRDALQQPSAGSLVQAIGMSASVHPTVGRFVLDEDSVFLLCSDGLSDYELVEQCWQTEILPILDGKLDLATASKRLVEVGNTRNGHDNITVALVHCQINFCEPETPLSYSLLMSVASTTSMPKVNTVLSEGSRTLVDDSSSPDTQLLPSVRKSQSWLLPMFLGIGLAISLGGGLLAYLASQGILPWAVGVGVRHNPPQSIPTTSTSLPPGSVMLAKNKLVLNRMANQEGAEDSPNQQQFSPIKGIVLAGSVLQILDQKPLIGQENWLNLKVIEVCSLPSTQRPNPQKPQPATNKSVNKTQSPPPATAGERLLQVGESGWIQTANLHQHLRTLTAAALDQRGDCSDLSPQIDEVPKSTKPAASPPTKVEHKAN